MTVDELLEPVRWKSARCHVAQALEELPAGRREQVAAAARNPQVPIPKLRKALEELIGASPKDQTVRRHRKRECACP